MAFRSRRRRPSRPDTVGSRRGYQRGLLLALFLLIHGARAEGAVATNEGSPLGTFATVQRALGAASTLPGTSAGHVAAEGSRDACRARPSTQTTCPALDVARCADAMRSLYDALARDTQEADRETRNLARVARILVSDALSRLTWARPRNDQLVCTIPFGPDHTAASIQISGDGRTIRMRPLRPLRAGRNYQLVVEGLADGEAVNWQAGSGAVTATSLDAHLTEAYDTLFSGESVRFDDREARALLHRLAVEASAIPDVPAAVGAQATLRAPLDAAALSRLRAWFEPATTPARSDAVIRFRTFDPRAGLIAYRKVFGQSGCASGEVGGLVLEPVDAGMTGSAIAGVYRGRYRSLDVAGKSATSRILGVAPSEARPTEQPFLLALPTGFSADTPVVLAVHGHGGRAEAMIKANAIGIARRGMATLAFDLPAHGERAQEEPFVDPLQPGRLTLGMRQATVDALALVHASTRCGFVLPDGRRVTPAALRFLGYSLGAAIGALLRSVEPELGTTVLVAPPGDLIDWQLTKIASRLGSDTYTICSGGPMHGHTCLSRPGECSQGACTADPDVVLLNDIVTSSYRAAFAGADAIAFAGEHTGVSTAPLLLMTGGLDLTVGPMAGPRLADVYGITFQAGSGRRGARTWFLYWPTLGHDIFGDDSVRDRAYDFLRSGGRRRPPPGARTG